MNTRRLNFILAGVIILLLAVGLFFVLKGQFNQVKPTQTEVSPCADTLTLQKDLSKIIAKIDSSEIAIRTLIAEKNHLQKALNAAIKRCRPDLSSGDTLYVKVVKPEVIPGKSSNNNYSRAKQPQTQTNKSTATEGQSVSSEYRAPVQKSVSTSVTGGNTPKALFCINLHDMDGSSFWPALAIDAGQKVENAVLNGTGDGWNISIYPVSEVSGLYGVTTDGRMFVKAELVDQFGPTVIKMSGSPNGWKMWVEAQLENVNGENYYITP